MPARAGKLLTIDTHHHMLPDFFWEETENAHAPIGGLAPLQWSKEASISFMDDAGIDVAVVSLSTPGVHTGDGAKARALARRCNEFSAELVRSRPDRFGGFACLPLPDVDAALEELSYTVDVLGLDGFVLFTNSNGAVSTDILHFRARVLVIQTARSCRRLIPDAVLPIYSCDGRCPVLKASPPGARARVPWV